METLEEMNEVLVGCRLCPRLVAWREEVGRVKRKSYEEWEYWSRPVPMFGDFSATRLIVGLAPAAHGGNRTGRMFTGDRSGDWLYRALHRAGAASQAESTHRGDGLALNGVLIAATVHCAPPGNKPLPIEIETCAGTYLARVLADRKWDSILCLGGIAWGEVHRRLGARRTAFAHVATHRLPTGTTLVASYHPSQQNTFTGRLTEAMLDEAIGRFMGQ